MTNSWREWLKPWTASALLFFAVVFFIARITAFLSDDFLFWLKLVSFIITAMFGVIGVMTDFRDQNKKLTLTGKLNLTGLALAAVIGVVAQKAEYDHAAIASADARNTMQGLISQNQVVLGRVTRTLEPSGDTISLDYELDFGIGKDAKWKQALRRLRDQVNRISPSGNYHDQQIKIERTIELDTSSQAKMDAGVKRPYISATFGNKSILAKGDGFYKDVFGGTPFLVSFQRSFPKPEKGSDCTFPPADVEYTWDETSPPVEQFALKNSGGFEPFQGGQTLYFYYEDMNALGEVATGNVLRVWYRTRVMPSVLDFGGTYMHIQPLHGLDFEFRKLSVQLGQRTVDLWAPVPESDDCGGFIYRIPVFRTN